MEQIRTWAVNLCVTLLVTGIFSMLVPNGNLEKVMKFGISTFFLCCLLLPFVHTVPSLASSVSESVVLPQTDRIEETMAEQLLSLSRYNMQQLVEQTLKRNGIEPKKIAVDVHISESNCVSINRIVVFTDDLQPNQAAEIKKILEKEIGMTPIVQEDESDA